jgi:hypothetical protein
MGMILPRTSGLVSASSLKEKDKEIDSLHDIVNNLEVRLEHQEQYSRRTSLRFHSIDVPVG